MRKLASSLLILFCTLVLGACAGSMPKLEPTGHTYFSNIRHSDKDSLNLFIRDEGKGDPVLLLHGFGANIFTWRYIFPELTRNNRVIAVDLKGFGQSDKPYDEKYSIFDQADLIVQLIEKMNLKKVTLVGHSFGGGVAIATVLKLQDKGSDRIKKLAILNGLAYEQPIPLFIHALRTPIISDLGIALLPPELHTRASLAYSYKHKHHITDEAVEHYAQPFYAMDARYAAKQTADQILPDNLEDYTSRYQSITMPVQLIWCRNDRVVPLENGLKLNAVLEKSNLVVLNECGHIPQEENPTETTEILEKFINTPRKPLKNRGNSKEIHKHKDKEQNKDHKKDENQLVYKPGSVRDNRDDHSSGT